MRYLLSVVFILFTLNSTIAQEKVPELKVKPSKAFFFEAGMPGWASINFDTRFKRSDTGLGMRAGLGLSFFWFDESVALFPLGINYLYGKNKSHYLDVGVGYTFIYQLSEIKQDNPGYGHINIGYRYAPKDRKLFMKAHYSPVFTFYEFLPLYFGVAIGVSVY